MLRSEQSHIMDNAGTVSIELINADGETTTLKSGLELEAGEVIDSSVMSKNALCEFITTAIADAKKQDVLLSLHMKAAMEKSLIRKSLATSSKSITLTSLKSIQRFWMN